MTPAVRRAIRVRGIVQGVGFRPYVYGLALRNRLGGFVRNDLEGVLVEVEGPLAAVEAFARALPREVPPLARIDAVSSEPREATGESRFIIDASQSKGHAQVLVSPDVATCADCLRELFDPADRRFRYPFTNCTSCGPRLTIVTETPYDRAHTTMASFTMCEACRREYEDPLDRRFHAQPVACPACGPRLVAHGHEGDALALAVAALREGKIVAVKGLGGFHLACDATREDAVLELRRRKRREEKPFAIMVADLDRVLEVADIRSEQRDLLASPARPIVLLSRRPESPVARSVAPDTDLVGIMLPYTPLHHLLLREVGPLVMTSGNRSSEPIARTDAEALERLADMVDLFLLHDRPIHVRCDDSVVRADGALPIPFRRSRGFAPAPLTLPLRLARPTLALGGHLKAVFALGHEKQAFASQHLGDLDDSLSRRAYADAVAHWIDLFRLAPERVVHDLHPDYASTLHALDHRGAELVAVQHHHAHMASGMAEHGLDGEVIGVVWDGAGLGADGTIWGGEFLKGGYAKVERVAHLRNVALPGGERAIHEPWRMALAHLMAAGLDASLLAARIPERTLDLVASLVAKRVQSPLTSSVGRLFDAVASLVLGSDRVSYEGQAAIRIEALAARAPEEGAYPFAIADPLVLDPAPLVRAIVEDLARGVAPERIARAFHSTLARAIAAVCDRLRAAHGVDRVVLGGGVFMNAILSDEATRRLEALGFRVFRHRHVPPNDGGLALGQLAVAAGLDAERS
ncbi:MAG TPA: carbamoyltransferase HypF [Planctomycetota bacterium]|nr:carbamoyltransferase HypF [Planctomycetota bacterium]